MTPKFVFGKEKNDWIKRPLLSNIEKILDYRGRTPKKLGLSWSDTGILALSALNVKNGYIDFNADANYGDQELYNRWMGDNNLHKGQVVFTTEAPMGNVAQIPNDALYILSQRTIAFEVKHHLIREDFLATLLRSPKIFNELTSLSSGGTAKGVSQKSLSNLKISVPASLDEQSAIGSLFRTLDDLLASYKDNLANYQSLKATMLSKMFPKAGQTVPEIRLDGFEGEWEKVMLKDVTESIEYGLNASAKEFDGENKYIRITDIDDVSRKFKEYSLTSPDINVSECDNYLLCEKDILFARTGASVGKTYLYDTKDGKVYFAGFLIRARIKEKFDSKFIFQNTLTNRFTQYVKVISQRSGQPGVNGKEYGEYELFLPKYKEQQAIGSYFSNLDNLINSYQEKISQLETLKKKLLQDMFI